MFLTKLRYPGLLFLLLLCPPVRSWGQSPSAKADTVIVNARIYTVNPKQPWAEALAIGDGKILAVGTANEIAAYRGPSTKTIDAQGKMVLPGFTDCHIHFMDGSLGLTQVDLNGAESVAGDSKAGEGIRRVSSQAGMDSGHGLDVFDIRRGRFA